MSLAFAEALRANSARYIAFIGSGGKTTAIFQLARQLKSPVFVTATSHMGTWQTSLADRHIVVEDADRLDRLSGKLPNVTLITGAVEMERALPVSDQTLRRIRAICDTRTIPLLIEADGSRQKPLKAWAEHEPPIPEFVDVVVQLVGMKGIGKPCTEEFVHRPEIFAERSGITIGGTVTSDGLSHALLHPDNPWDRFPAHARRVIVLNQADSPEQQAIAHSMVRQLYQHFHAVMISSLAEKRIHAVHEPVAGIILAAGESSRYGMPKQLLDWRGISFTRAVALTAIEAGLNPVILVTGAHAGKVSNTVAGLGVVVARNNEWKTGQASSIRVGLLSLSELTPGFRSVGAGVFLLVDQPHLTASILQALVEKHAETLDPIVAPMVMDRRANPVLFDKSTFRDLLTLEGDVGGRAIFHKHRVEYLPWHDDRLLLDVDTPDQYQRLVEDESL